MHRLQTLESAALPIATGITGTEPARAEAAVVHAHDVWHHTALEVLRSGRATVHDVRSIAGVAGELLQQGADLLTAAPAGNRRNHHLIPALWDASQGWDLVRHHLDPLHEMRPIQ